jgi:hypothetical protein
VGKAALDFVVQAHREHDSGMMHIHEDNTLAYAVARDGDVFDSGKFSGGGEYEPGLAADEAKEIASATKGFVAVMFSDMTGGWYNATLEMDFLALAREEIRNSINNYFPTTT